MNRWRWRDCDVSRNSSPQMTVKQLNVLRNLGLELIHFVGIDGTDRVVRIVVSWHIDETSGSAVTSALISLTDSQQTDRPVFITAAKSCSSLGTIASCGITSQTHCRHRPECLPNGLSAHCDRDRESTIYRRRVFGATCRPVGDRAPCSLSLLACYFARDWYSTLTVHSKFVVLSLYA